MLPKASTVIKSRAGIQILFWLLKSMSFPRLYTSSELFPELRVSKYEDDAMLSRNKKANSMSKIFKCNWTYIMKIPQMHLFTSFIQCGVYSKWHIREVRTKQKGKYTWCPQAAGQGTASRDPLNIQWPKYHILIFILSNACWDICTLHTWESWRRSTTSIQGSDYIHRASPSPCVCPSVKRDAGTRTNLEPLLWKDALLNKKHPKKEKNNSWIPGKEVTSISVLQVTQAHRPQEQHASGRVGKFRGNFAVKWR